MATYNPKTKTWSHEADPLDDFVSIGSYLAEPIFKRFNEANPEQIAEINGDTGEIFTVKDIHHGTITAAKNFIELGAGPDDKVVIFCRINSHISSIIYALYSLGIPFCPLDVISYDLEYLFDYIEPTILICDEEFIEEVESSLKRKTCESLKHKLVFGVNAKEILFKAQCLSPLPHPTFTKLPEELVACLILTSGTTGKPKVAKISHSMLVNCINTLRHSKFNAPNDNLFGIAGVRWISHINRMLCSILFESPQTFTGKDPDPKNICEIIEKFKCTMLLAPNSFLQEVFDHYKRNPKYDLSSLKQVLNGGETPLEAVNHKWKQEFAGLNTVNGYGITEVAGLVALNKGRCGLINGGELHRGYQVRIVGENGQALGPEENGIVLIKLRVPYLKYYECPEDNRKSFTPDGWFITGDYGKMTVGNNLHIYCRFKDIPKCKGILLIPNLVEEYINQHPLVNLGVIVGVENDKIVIFIKSVAGGDTKTQTTVKSELNVYLRRYIDLGIVEKVVYLETFKVISTGKVDKQGMKQEYLNGAYND